MASFSERDTIRILVTTDNHVGYNERDPVRGDDSWKTFEEIMCLAKDRDVDMVLMAGDLFHENKPSRKALYQVMRSLRSNCFGNKPCELQMLSDGSEHFAGSFNHVNYEDQDMNVAIPCFSIHGNHDDPSGEGHLAALDIVSVAGLINYYGRTPESDNIHIKPVLLQKGQTKLALYGMSNVRDERLFRTFRDGHVTFYQPSIQSGDFFNIMSVHQNHHAYSETGYLPERFLPSWMDLIIWGHEHECKIDPELNTNMNFKVMQPGSSVATSLDKGETVAKHVAILSVSGTDFKSESIRLKTVRPFLRKEIVLKDSSQGEKLAKVKDADQQRNKITQYLTTVVDNMIKEATDEWLGLQEEELEEDEAPPLPIIRLRVEQTAPEGCEYHFDNPQRFSRMFAGRVANATDVIQIHKKKGGFKRDKAQPDMPEMTSISDMRLDTTAVDKLVEEFLTAQSLQVLPQNSFSDAVGQFVNKDDTHAMKEFLRDSLQAQIDGLVGKGDDDEEEEEEKNGFNDDLIYEAMAANREMLDASYASGVRKLPRNPGTRKPRPQDWDSDAQGVSWEDSILSMRVDETAKGRSAGGDDDENDDDDAVSITSSTRPTRGRGSRGGARRGKSTAGTTRTAPAPRKAPAKPTARAKNNQPFEEDDSDVVMIDEDEPDESPSLFVSQASSRSARTQQTRAAPAPAPASRGRTAAGRGTAAAARSATQQTLSFGNGTTSTRTNGTRAAASKRTIPSEDEISDDDDAFEPPPAAQRSTARSGRR